jgi:hypothetical protein
MTRSEFGIPESLGSLTDDLAAIAVRFNVDVNALRALAEAIMADHHSIADECKDVTPPAIRDTFLAVTDELLRRNRSR